MLSSSPDTSHVNKSLLLQPLEEALTSQLVSFPDSVRPSVESLGMRLAVSLGKFLMLVAIVLVVSPHALCHSSKAKIYNVIQIQI